MKKTLLIVLCLAVSVIAAAQSTRIKQSSFRYLSNGAIKVTRDKYSGSIHIKAVKGLVTTFGYRHFVTDEDPAENTIREIPAYGRYIRPGDKDLTYYPDGKSWIVVIYTNPKTKQPAELILHPKG